MYNLTFTERDMMLISMAVQELPEKERSALVAKINAQIADQMAKAEAAETTTA